jgi:rubrerythrin
MKEQPSTGMNRTGAQMSPFDTSSMQAVSPQAQAEAPPGDESAIAQLRFSYIQEAEPLGSIPPPGTVTGAVSTGVSMLTGNEPQLLLDKLGERLAFERTGTRLYDALIAKFVAHGQGTDGAEGNMTLEQLKKIRADEARHFAMVANAMESIGADPTAQTPCADVAAVESHGIMQVVTDPRTGMAQSLHAILIAELADNAGWEMLIALAKEQGHQTMISEFQLALDDEREHLQNIRMWLEETTFGKVISVNAAEVSAVSSQLH